MNRQTTPPFMLQLFYRTGAFHRPDEFASSPLPPHLTLHTWPDCTLTELTHQLAAASSSSSSSPNLSTTAPILPDPAIGTRLAFRLIFPDARGDAPRYMVKDLGSVVIGDEDAESVVASAAASPSLDTGGSGDGAKTLADARFVVGDYISVAILPPLADGSVAPASAARMGRGAEARVVVGRAPAGGRDRDRERERGENGFARSSGLAVSRGRNAGRAGGGLDGGGGGFGGGGGRTGVPMGEWRRGERLPEMPSVGRGRGRGRY
ncbi:Sin3 associated polypeptide p18-domain-containing protein [Whalleya microplaca]|nr:Sin3 associated polypeptide p18-domain-containing protein [Whalleya microplaca]